MEREFKVDLLLTAPSTTETRINTGENNHLLTVDRPPSCTPKNKPKNVKSAKLLDVVFSGRLENDSKATLKSIISLEKTANFEIFLSIPPKSFIDSAVKSFQKWTDISLELPFIIGMQMLAAYLVQNGNHIDRSGKLLFSDLWSIVLESSGGGKSFTMSCYERAGLEINKFPEGIQSSARFIEELSHCPKSFWVRDEFSQLLKGMESQVYLEELKGYLLLIYDNKTINRSTGTGNKCKDIIAENPVMNILGLNTPESFIKNVSAESMIDGFSQRFNYVWVKPDTNRKPLTVALYNDSQIEKDIKKAWDKLKKPEQGQKYYLSTSAVKAFEDNFYFYAREFDGEIPPSFMRRTLFKALKYSFIYHILLNKAKKKQIDSEDMDWAMRITWFHLFDMKELLNQYGLSETGKLVKQVELLKDKFNSDGKTLKPRDVVIGVKNIRNVREAQEILSLVNAG